jgi:transposase
MTGYEKRTRAQGAAAVVGVDAGKFEHAMVVRPRGGRDTKPLTFRTSREGFEKAVAVILEAAGPGATPPDVLVGIEFAGTYGFTFAHFLHQLGFPVVSVLPAHTKKWKEVVHNQNLKTDAKDAVGITDLVAQGHFVSFPFLDSVYADLRYLVSTRERLSLLRRGAITRLKATLEVVFPEYERIFVQITKPTALAVLKAYPCPDALLAAPKPKVMKLLRETSRNHLGTARYDELIEAARKTLALTGTHRVLKDEVPMLIELIETYSGQIAQVEALMTEALDRTPEAPYLLSIPGVAPVTAAVFLGSIGDPAAYDSSKQVLRVAGLTLVERSSGQLKGQKRISKRGRPVFRRHAYIFAVRSVQKDGLFRAEYEALCGRNGGRKIAALTAISRSALKLMFSIARDRRMYSVEAPRPVQRARASAA